MTVPSSPKPLKDYIYTGPGDYDFEFLILEESDIQVRHLSIDGVTTIWVIGVDFTISMAPGGASGGIVVASNIATDGTIYIYRQLPLSQDTIWANTGPFRDDLLEDDLDKIVMLLQEMRLVVDGENVSVNWVGDWLPLTWYETNQIATGPNGSWYSARTNHTSSEDFYADLAGGNWSLALDVEAINDSEAAAVAAAEQAALDRIATGEDRVQTGLDRVQTSSDRTQTGLDRVQTAADRVQTGLDVAATGGVVSAAEDARDLAKSYASGEDPLGEPATGSAAYWANQASIYSKGVNPNIIINPNFLINQEERVTPSITVGEEYIRDMWKVQAIGGSPTLTVTGEEVAFGFVAINHKNEDLIALSNGSDITVTVSIATGTLPVSNYAVSKTISPGDPFTFTYNSTTASGNLRFGYEGSSYTFSGLKLEAGPVATPYVIPQITAEELKCFRYFFNHLEYVAPIRSQGAVTYQLGTVITPVQMRSDLTVSLASGKTMSCFCNGTVRHINGPQEYSGVEVTVLRNSVLIEYFVLSTAWDASTADHAGLIEGIWSLVLDARY